MFYLCVIAQINITCVLKIFHIYVPHRADEGRNTVLMKLEEVTRSKTKISCANCHTRDFCLPQNINDYEIDRVNRIVQMRRTIKKGSKLIKPGMAFHAIYAIRTGFFKTSVSTESGQEQLLGFQMTGDSLGMDGIATQKHSSDVVALEDSDICVFPIHEIENLSRVSPVFQRHFLQMLSKEIVRESQSMLMLSQMSAEVRVASFIQNLIQRLRARGFSNTELLLRMTRVEMGQYLGLKLETISRTLSKLSHNNIIEINRRHFRILDKAGLTRITGISD